jgi:cation/acetate symporter
VIDPEHLAKRPTRQSAAWSVPLSFATMVAVSRMTKYRLPVHTSPFMVRLHTPETVQPERG